MFESFSRSLIHWIKRLKAPAELGPCPLLQHLRNPTINAAAPITAEFITPLSQAVDLPAFRWLLSHHLCSRRIHSVAVPRPGLLNTGPWVRTAPERTLVLDSPAPLCHTIS